MADSSDVEIALAASLGASCCPNGVGAPGPTGAIARIMRGRPASTVLVADRAAGIADIAVRALPETCRNTTRWGTQTYVVPGVAGIGVTGSANSVTFSGVAREGDLAGILAGGLAYVYAAQPGDSAERVAASLACAIRTGMLCWLSGATLTVPALTSIAGRVAAAGTSLMEWARQEQKFCISVWSGQAGARDALAGLVRASLAPVAWLPLGDGTEARLRAAGEANDDSEQAGGVFRRDLTYDAEYATTTSVLSPSMLFGDLDYNGLTIYA